MQRQMNRIGAMGFFAGAQNDTRRVLGMTRGVAGRERDSSLALRMTKGEALGMARKSVEGQEGGRAILFTF